MTTSGYGKIESDESEVSYQRLEKIAEVLGIKVEDIVNFNEKLIFNEMNNTQALQGYVVINGNSSVQDKNLYEQMITQLKEENTYLKSIIDKLR